MSYRVACPPSAPTPKRWAILRREARPALAWCLLGVVAAWSTTEAVSWWLGVGPGLVKFAMTLGGYVTRWAMYFVGRDHR